MLQCETSHTSLWKTRLFCVCLYRNNMYILCVTSQRSLPNPTLVWIRKNWGFPNSRIRSLNLSKNANLCREDRDNPGL